MTTTHIPGPVDWDALTTDQVHEAIRDAYRSLEAREDDAPTAGVLDRARQFEETLRAGTPLQYRYAGLLKDAFDNTALRHTVGLSEGKTAFRDANDFLAKTHGIRANEAAARMRLTASMTPARATDPEPRAPVGQTRLPILGAFQGRVNPSKLSSALSMIDEIDDNAEAAGKDAAFRAKLREVIEKDLAQKIEHTTPEEFSRYVGQRKKDLLASIDPPDQGFTQAHTDTMYQVHRVGPVRGNKNAIEYRLVTDAEGDESLQTLLTAATNPRGKDEHDTAFDTRSRGHRRMHALRDAIKFVLANYDKTGFRSASGAHTQMLVVTDYATLLEGIRHELATLLPDIHAAQREKLLQLLTAMQLEDSDAQDTEQAAYLPELPHDAAELPPSNGSSPPVTASGQWGQRTLPQPKTTDVAELLDDPNLDRLQPRIAQGVYNPYIPPQAILRMRCDVGLTPVTLTGERQVLSIGRSDRQFPDHLRRAIQARDRGCAVPGCHTPASLCEIHHYLYWSQGGVTSTDNGLLLCAHHHAAVHAEALRIVRVDGEFRFVLHPLIDPTQQPRKNFFYQA